MKILYVIEKINKHGDKTLYSSYNKKDTLRMFNYLKEEEYNVTLKKFREMKE